MKLKIRINYPFILVNFKTYKEACEKKAIELASIAKEISETTGVCIAISPQMVDLRMVAKEVNIPVFAQHIDPIGYGKYTGHLLPE